MEGILKVTPDQLRSTASEFSGTNANIKGLTDQMIQIVNEMNGEIWHGDAAQAYFNKFNGLKDDMGNIYTDIDTHVNGLNDMAQRYDQAEIKNVEESAPLKSDIV